MRSIYCGDDEDELSWAGDEAMVLGVDLSQRYFAVCRDI